MVKSTALKLFLVSGTALAGFCAVPGIAMAQDTTAEAATPTGAETSDEGGSEILVTGSRIKQDPNNSALPLQIITNQEISA
jgi:iron complex outermembrane receptor protein